MQLGRNVRGKHSKSPGLQGGGGGDKQVITQTPNAQDIIDES